MDQCRQYQTVQTASYHVSRSLLLGKYKGAGSEVPPSEAPFKGAWRVWGRGGKRTKAWRLKGASPSKGFNGASRGLEASLRGRLPSEGFKGAWKDFKGAWRGLEEGLKGASSLQRWRGLRGGFKGASRGFKGAWRGLDLEGGLKGASRSPSRGPWKGFQAFSVEGHLKGTSWSPAAFKPPSSRLEAPFKPPSSPLQISSGPFEAFRRWSPPLQAFVKGTFEDARDSF